MYQQLNEYLLQIEKRRRILAREAAKRQVSFPNAEFLQGG
jgi:hypothetical protein